MKILIVGGGGREHALAWMLATRGHEIFAAPGNPGIASVATCLPVKTDDLAGQVAAARGMDLVVVGPEAPLCAGLADMMAAAGIACFGPRADGARLEGSKAWSKEFFARHGIPTAAFEICETPAEVDSALARLGGQVVVKADGLAAGKGVVVCHDADEARAAAHRMLVERAFGEAGARVVIERRLSGREVSLLAITDGKRFVVLPAAEDHKSIFDGDRGPNTGGMGVVSPTPVADAALLERARREIFAPTLAGLCAEGIDYRGVLYAGLMVAEDGTPWALEYNCRFGDPETEALALRWADDPAPWLAGAAGGQLPDGDPAFHADASVCVIMAAAGYPGTPRIGDRIDGIDQIHDDTTQVFHAGTRRDGQALVTAGGRVLAVTARGPDVAEARRRAYDAVSRIDFAGAQFRRDIGLRSNNEGMNVT